MSVNGHTQSSQLQIVLDTVNTNKTEPISTDVPFHNYYHVDVLSTCEVGKVIDGSSKVQILMHYTTLQCSQHK